MSLTSFLKQDNVKNLFDTYFNFSGYRVVTTNYTPPLTENYALVGTAFDYLLRFHLAKLNNVENVKWVALHALRSREEYRAEKAIINARVSFERNDKENWAEHCLRLAMLDEYARVRSLNLRPINKYDIDDLNNLIEICPLDIFKTDKGILNPTFGGSKLVGGADADFILGDMLIDIKTTKYSTMTINMFRQLVGYKLLGNETGVTDYNYTVKRTGIYFARHGILENVDIDIPQDFIERFFELASS